MINLFPDVKAPNGMAYAWKRVALVGEADVENVKKMAGDGWIPVPCIRHPEIQSGDQEYIVVGGLMLCERPADVEAAARRAMTKAADDAYNAAAENLERAAAAAGEKISAPRSINGVVVYPKNDDTEGTRH